MSESVPLDPKTAARFLGISPRTLEAYRLKGVGPRYLRLSARCYRYRPDDLAAWLNARVCGAAPAIPIAA